jgi:polyisoprenoid-binding protein YceI
MNCARVSMTTVFLLACESGVATQQATPHATQHTTQGAAIDTRHSVMTVRVYRAGAFAAFGHDHEIAAPIAAGSVNFAAHQVELHVDARTLCVEDADASEKDRGEIRKTMLGPEVLDVEHYPAIVFRSTSMEPAGAGSWRILGNLVLHGTTQPVTVDVMEKAGHYTGHALVKQTDFGIKPVRAGGGTVRVKDEVRIEFNIELAHARQST